MKRFYQLLLCVFIPLAGVGSARAAQLINDLTIQRTLIMQGDVTPSTITSDQNDYAPASFSTAATLRLSTDASRNLTGLAGGAAGRVVRVSNVGSFSLVLKNASASSIAANRFAIGADITLTANTGVLLQYDGTTSNWRAVGAPGAGGGASAFTSLTDAPSSYSGQALKAVTVNAGETALVFTTLTGGGNALTSNPLSQFASTTSLQLAGVLSDETGTGANVFGTAPTITGGTHTALTGLGIRSTGAAFDLSLASAEVFTAGRTLTFSLGDAARTLSLSGNPTLSGFTATGTGTLALGAKTLTVSNTLTLAGTDSTTMTFPSTTATIARTDAANTFTGASTGTSWTLTTPVIAGGLTASGAGANTFVGSSGTFITSTGANTLSGAVTINDATTPSLTTASGKTNTGFVQINGKTTGALKITSADAAAQTVTLNLAAQTTGAGTANIPDLAGASDSIAFLARAQIFTNAVYTTSTLKSDTGLQIKDLTSNYLGFASVSAGAMTANRQINWNIGDVDRTVSIQGNLTLGGAFTTASGKALTFNNSLTFAGTDSTTMTFPSTTATIARTDAANTFTGVQTMTSAALTTPVIAGGLTASGAGSLTFVGSSATFITSTGANTLSGATTINDATTPSLTTASGKTNTGFVQVNGKTSGSLKIITADATAQAVTVTAAAQTTGATTLTIPDMANVSDTFVFLAKAQTLTTKTLTSPVINGATSSGSTALDFSGSTGTFKTSTGTNTLGGSGTVTNVPGTTSATTSLLGALTIGNGSAATNVGIGAGNVNIGGTLAVGGTSAFADNITLTKAAGTITSVSSAGRPTWINRSSGTTGSTTDTPVYQFNRATNALPSGSSVGEMRFDGLNTGSTYALYGEIVVTTTGASTSTGSPSRIDFVVADGTTTQTPLAIGPTIVAIAPTTASTTTTTGALTVAGGVGVAGNLNIGGTASVGGAAITNNIPQNSQSTAYTVVLSDAGKHIYHPSADTTARTWTIDSNANVAYPIGTAITFINDTSAGTVTIAITSDTLVLAGAGTTGSRTLAPGGVATAIKITSTRWIISGTGLTFNFRFMRPLQPERSMLAMASVHEFPMAAKLEEAA